MSPLPASPITPLATAGEIFTQRELRDAYALFPSGVVAVCALINSAPVGMVMSSFTSVSLEPPLVSVCVDVKSGTWPVLAGARRLGISILGADHGAVARSLASRHRDRFGDVQWSATESGAVMIEGASLWLECDIQQVVRAGDHDIILLSPSVIRPHLQHAPLVFHGSEFRRLAS